jgi:predicted component of type VI protein secretion system
MSLQMKIVSEHRDLVGDDYLREFHEDGGTIGRSLMNDWILPDPDRYISGRHATIDYKGGIYYLADTSSNGVYMNDEVEPIGKGNPRRLFNGDRLRMGDFIFEVSIDSGESLVMPMEPKPSVVHGQNEQFVDEVSLRTGTKLLDEDELTGDSEFQSVLFGNKAPEMPVTVQEAAPAPLEPDTRADSDRLAVSAEDLFDSFLDGLGISRVELHPSVNRPEVMMTAGLVLREFVKGTIDLLSSRANLKNAFRLDQTTVLPRQNNPLKFSENTNDLIKQLLVGSEGEYLGARDAVREACRDLMNHQNAFLDAMNSAFIEFADRFDPDELEESFKRALDGGKFFSFMNKSKYWDLYCDLYPIMTEKGGGRFPQMFAEEFVKAYERQVAEYQRHDREGTTAPPKVTAAAAEPDLMATQKLDAPVALAPADADAEPEPVDQAGTSSALDESFIEELDNSMAGEIPRGQRKA